MSMRRSMARATAGLVISLGAGHMNTLHAQRLETDQQFVNQVAADNMLEVRMGQLAQNKAQSPAVRKFAQRMESDHTSMQNQWMAAARKNNLDFKAEFEQRHRDQADQLKDLSGTAFDRAYMAMMVQNHRANVSSFQTELNAGHSADVRQLIEVALPTLQEHVSAAQQISGQVGSDITATGLPQRDTTSAVATQTAQATQNLRADSAFISEVDASNVAELRLARLAESKAGDPLVKRFAQRMVTDHGNMRREWGAVSTRNSLRFNAAINPRHQEQMTRLERLSGTEFDRSYMAAMVQNHQENVNSFQAKGRSAQSSDVRQLVNRYLPLLQEHLALAQQASSQVGAVATQTTPATQNLRADSAFISEVDASNVAELRLARLAESKAGESVVKRFAQRMVTDHGKMRREWGEVSTRNSLRFNAVINARHQEQMTRLERLSGTEFDRAYMAAMVQNHQENVNSFQTKGRAAQSSDVRQLVNLSLPSLQEHLALAQQIASQVGTGAVATGTDQGKRGNVTSDREFIRDVDADNFLEIRLGRLAERKGSDPSVKQFGSTMVNGHTSLQRQWSTMASNNGMKFKSGMGRRHRSKLDRMEKLSGREFDREYMTLMVRNHKDYLDYFRKEGRGANSAAVRELVNQGIPLLEEHMRQAKQVGGRVGADTTTSRYGRISAN